MRLIQKKLHSRRGASAVIALLFFLVCLMVGAVILTAATANAGRLTHLRSDQEDYFLISSAARLIRDDIKNARYVVSETSVNGGEVKKGYTEPSNDIHLRSKLSAWAREVYESESYTSSRIPFSITYDEQRVNAAAYIYGKNAANAYSIEMYFSIAKEDGSGAEPDKDNYMLRLYIPATLTEKEESTSGASNSKTEIKKTTITWGDGIISKAGEEKE